MTVHSVSTTEGGVTSEIAQMLSSILDAASSENLEMLEAVEQIPLIQQATAALKHQDLATTRRLMNDPLEKIKEAFYSKHLRSDELTFLMINYDFVEGLFEEVVTANEGDYCCADKAEYLMECIVAFYQDGREIHHDYNGRETYFLPRKVFTTHDEIVAFFKAIWHLYYGSPKDYLKAKHHYAAMPGGTASV
ncbi:hypothetical protein [Thalassospira xiamenensis]|uniref:Uncharacterized protein n=1 Tax=Thalassospira xiamenensis TaxID=220697 RepID=A0A285TLJ5_9PROT|nr:hypothetical protein [Thalassospira xiamenensis]SOC21341.1 hypothetical protein SAMN05428964_103378 [Thalassospira xiamenensis]